MSGPELTFEQVLKLLPRTRGTQVTPREPFPETQNYKWIGALGFVGGANHQKRNYSHLNALGWAGHGMPVFITSILLHLMDALEK